jgi:hypothetical protein
MRDTILELATMDDRELLRRHSVDLTGSQFQSRVSICYFAAQMEVGKASVKFCPKRNAKPTALRRRRKR